MSWWARLVHSARDPRKWASPHQAETALGVAV